MRLNTLALWKAILCIRKGCFRLAAAEWAELEHPLVISALLIRHHKETFRCPIHRKIGVQQEIVRPWAGRALQSRENLFP